MRQLNSEKMAVLHRKILHMLGISLIFGFLGGIIFGYLYSQYVKFFIISLSISSSIGLVNTLLMVTVIPKARIFFGKKALIAEFTIFFLGSFIGFFLPMALMSKIFAFEIFEKKDFFITIVLLIILYISVSGIVLSARFYKELKEQEISSEKLKSAASEAKLKLLKSQINPHFLFNTLNSINALITENPGLSRKMISLLSALLRNALESHEHQLVILQKELDFTHLYLEIEKIRFKDKLIFSESIDESLLNSFFPAMILQPLLENAVKHGIYDNRTRGKIELVIKQDGEFIECRITNPVSNVKSNQKKKSLSNGLGLLNIRRRLDLLYKENYSFQTQFIDESKFTAILTIPLSQEGHDE